MDSAHRAVRFAHSGYILLPSDWQLQLRLVVGNGAVNAIMLPNFPQNTHGRVVAMVGVNNQRPE